MSCSRLVAVPLVEAHGERGIDRTLGAEPGAVAHAEPDGVEASGSERQLQVDPRRSHRAAARGRVPQREHRLGMACAERGQLLQVRCSPVGEVGVLDPGVDPAARLEVLAREPDGGVGLERVPERLHLTALDRDAGGVPVAAEARQVGAAGRERVVQVEGLDGAPAPLPGAVLQGHQHHRPVEALHQARGDDPDHAGVPARRAPAPAREPPPPPGPRRRRAPRRGCAARSPAGPGSRDRAPRPGPGPSRASSVSSRRTPRPASSSRPAALMRGARRKPTWPAVTGTASPTPATRLRARSPGRRVRRQHLQAPAHQDAVRAHQRDHVGHRAERHQVQRLLAGSARAARGRSGPVSRSRRRRAITSAKVTPTAARSLVGYPQPSWCGFRMATAAGSSTGTVWWSTTTVSTPSTAAARTSSRLVMPQSSVTSSFTPSRGELRHGLAVEAVSLDQPVRDVLDDLATGRPQEAGQERGGGDAVDVVVAVAGDALARPGGPAGCAPRPGPCPSWRRDRAGRPAARQELRGRVVRRAP